MMQVDQELQDFIEENTTLIDQNEWKEVYQKAMDKFALNPEYIGKFTELCLAVDINPLLYMETVPDFFLFDVKSVLNFSIPDCISSIGIRAFSQSSINKIFFPKTITFIENTAFMGCMNLRDIDVENLFSFLQIKYRYDVSIALQLPFQNQAVYSQNGELLLGALYQDRTDISAGQISGGPIEWKRTDISIDVWEPTYATLGGNLNVTVPSKYHISGIKID